ncbi:MAG: DUF5715 family protein [Bacteroidota bacterium]
MSRGAAQRLPLALVLLLAVSACTSAEEQAAQEAALRDDAERSLTIQMAAAMEQIDAYAAEIDAVMQPLPLLRGREEAALFDASPRHLAAARRLGIIPGADVPPLLEDGTLVTLVDSPHWVVRDLDYSQPYVTPATVAFLTDLGTRFQAALADLGWPPLRMEVTSVLRTAESQAALRQVNPNAALGTSAHEYGTTVDLTYAAFRAPAEPVRAYGTAPEPLAATLQQIEALAIERVAGRRSRELQAILGRVLIEMRAEGQVLITLERRQPVYHITVTRGV